MARALVRAVLPALAAPRAAAPPAAFRNCSPAGARGAVRAFVAAFDRGDARRLDALFAPDDGDGDAATPSFQWYASGAPGARLGANAHDRATLVPYLIARRRRGERLRLVKLEGGGSVHGYANFTFHVRRSARDLRRPGLFEGNDAAICGGPRAQIAVWSLGGRVPAG